jgi:hypothetical protein
VAEQSLPAPTLVKIDVEGAELEVLNGMWRTIASSRPILLYELDDGDQVSFNLRWDKLDDLVRSFSYQIRRLERSYPSLKWHVGHSIALPSVKG